MMQALRRSRILKSFAAIVFALALLVAPRQALAEATASVVFSGPLNILIPSLVRQFPGLRMVPDTAAAGRHLHNFTLQNATLSQALVALQREAHVRARVQNGTVLLVGASDGSFGADATVVSFPLRFGAARDVAEQMSHAFSGRNGSSVMADARTNSVVYVGDPEYVPMVETMLSVFDVNDGIGTNTTRSVELNHLSTEEAVKQLGAAFPAASGASSLIFTEDKLNNGVILQGPIGYVERAEALLKQLDARPGRQVNVAVRVVDVTPQNDAKSIGVIFGGISTQNSGGGSATSSASTTPYRFFMQSIGSAVSVNAALDAMVQHGEASVLASPNTSVINGETASLLVGQQDPIVFNNGGFTSGNTYRTVDSGVILRFTALQLGADGSMTLKLHTEYSQVINYSVVQGVAYPKLGQRQADTVLHVRNGQSIVLGGLTQDVQSRTESSVPVLGSIPLFGKLFHHVDSQHVKEQIIFEITPTLLEV